MLIKTISFYVIKGIFLIVSWFVLFLFDLEQINFNMFFISTFIYAGSIVFDLLPIMWKSNQPSALVKLAKFLSMILFVANFVVVIISLCFSNWIEIVVVNDVYIFKITMESFVSIFNVSPNLFSLKDFMIFVLVAGVASLVPSVLVDFADIILVQKRNRANKK